MKRRIVRAVRNIGISIVVLLVLVLGIGVAYTWYIGQNTSTATSAPPIQPMVTSAAISTKGRTPAPDAPASASIQQLSSPVRPGAMADITVRSNPTATCRIAVEYDNKQPSTSPAFIEKATDDFGMVNWQWAVDTTAPKGKATVTVTCALDEKRSAVIKGEFDIAP